MQVDTLIIGQGLCGSFLSWNLLNEGQRVMVVDTAKLYTATKVASGVINPVTGRRIVRTWEIETFMPFAVNAYQEMGKELSVELIRQCNVLDFHSTPENKIAFSERLKTETEYLSEVDEKNWNSFFHLQFGIGEIHPCWLIQLNDLLEGWRKKLISANALIESKFNFHDCMVKDEIIHWKDISADRIIFCDGNAGTTNPWFQLLPFAPNKGEAIIASIPDLPRNHIYKQSLSLVPWKEDLFWIGSTYEWKYDHPNPTPAFREKVEFQLKNWLKLPYQIVDHMASERPANIERRPFVGFHPIQKNIGILNGMGTKGCSLAPYFAHQFAQHIINNQPIHTLASIDRFKNILSR
ncbi:FAD-binding oxidoreductase [Sediminibacterium sp. C3]|uniref:NAD(P)/FAD-dependent oxidoreductase n=1 Tax=Sediminibacterium sp. C3 TaxID=1267211 RepID=UPI00047BBCA3|nr:FAD-dependent oxidoreductase [Sediminibacterium sp. C3]